MYTSVDSDTDYPDFAQTTCPSCTKLLLRISWTSCVSICDHNDSTTNYHVSIHVTNGIITIP